MTCRRRNLTAKPRIELRRPCNLTAKPQIELR